MNTQESREWCDFFRSADYDLIVNDKDDNGTPYLKHLFDLHLYLFGEVCQSCPSKIEGYVRRIKNVNLNTMEQKKKSDFQLKRGTVIPIFGTSSSYNESNITDEIAIKLISENENRIKLFMKFPEDWKDRVSEAKRETEPVEPKKRQLKKLKKRTL